MARQKYVMQVELDSSRVPQQYEQLMRRLNNIQRRYQNVTNISVGARGSGRGGGGGGSARGPAGFAQSQTAANIRESISRTVGDANRMLDSNVMSSAQSAALSSVVNRLQEIRRSIAGATSRRDIARLSANYREATAEARRLMRAQEAINRQLSIGAQAGNAFSNSLRRAGLHLASIYAIGKAGGEIFRIGKEMDAMQAGLLAASASAEEATDNFEFLRKTSQRLGQDIQVGVRGYNRLAVAARGAGMTTKEAQEVFLAASEASTTFQLDQQRSNLVMLAMSQMMS